MSAIKSAALALVGAAIMVIAACAAAADPIPAPPTSAPPISGPAAPGVGQSANEDPVDAYRLDTGDKVKVTVFNEPTLSGDFVVDGQGVISMSLIGEVPAKNLTLRQLQTSIENKLKDGWVRQPQVSTEVTNFRPYFILGEVTKAGEYPYSSGLTVMRAVAAAGDFTYRADKKKVFIKSVNSPDEKEVALTPSTLVHPGDTIRIRERFF